MAVKWGRLGDMTEAAQDMNAHGIEVGAVVIQRGTDPVILLVCECGWHNYPRTGDLDDLTQIGERHRQSCAHEVENAGPWESEPGSRRFVITHGIGSTHVEETPRCDFAVEDNQTGLCVCGRLMSNHPHAT